MKYKHFAALAAGFLLATSSMAAPFQGVQLDKSSITFRYKQMGVSMDGKFGKFASTLSFDPAKPEQASATIDIDLASIDTGSGEGVWSKFDVIANDVLVNFQLTVQAGK